jgi:N-acetylglucosamine kinase-like BadF-type ATPase
MRIFMGVDGGGSKTHTVIMDETGKNLGSGLSGCGNHQIFGIDKAIKNIWNSIEQALQQAALASSYIDYVQYGLSGADREKDFTILRSALSSFPFRQWDIVCDTMEGLRIGSKENIGVVVVCGSATNVAGRNPKGKTIQTGGFGYLYGDAAGGGHMATETFRAAVRSWELREIPSRLTSLVPEFLGYDSLETMHNHMLDEDIYSVSRDLTQVLHQAADEGDELAINLLRKTGEELGIAAVSVIRRLGGFQGFKVPIVLVGSVLQKGRNKNLLNKLYETIAKEKIEFQLIIPEIEPVYGSVLLAMDQLNVQDIQQLEGKFTTYGGDII